MFAQDQVSWVSMIKAHVLQTSLIRTHSIAKRHHNQPLARKQKCCVCVFLGAVGDGDHTSHGELQQQITGVSHQKRHQKLKVVCATAAEAEQVSVYKLAVSTADFKLQGQDPQATSRSQTWTPFHCFG